MIYTIFEYKPENFAPFSINHATFEVRSGAFSDIDRILHIIKPDDKVILIVRDEISELVSERFPNLNITLATADAVLLANYLKETKKK